MRKNYYNDAYAKRCALLIGPILLLFSVFIIVGLVSGAVASESPWWHVAFSIGLAIVSTVLIVHGLRRQPNSPAKASTSLWQVENRTAIAHCFSAARTCMNGDLLVTCPARWKKMLALPIWLLLGVLLGLQALAIFRENSGGFLYLLGSFLLGLAFLMLSTSAFAVWIVIKGVPRMTVSKSSLQLTLLHRSTRIVWSAIREVAANDEHNTVAITFVDTEDNDVSATETLSRELNIDAVYGCTKDELAAFLNECRASLA